MDQTPEPTLEDSLKQVMRTLPPVIRTYLAQGKYTPVAKGLMAKYTLRIDQGGVLEREIMLLLMGVEDPADFTKTLAEEAGLDPKTIGSIAQDVNEQIFAPLRAEMMKSGMAAEQAAPSAPRPAEAFGIGGAPVGEEQPEELFHLKNKIISPARPVVASPVSQPGSTLGDVVRSILPPQKPVDSSRLLEDHEEPHIEINKIPIPIASVPAAARFISARPSMPPGGEIPANLPGAMSPAAPFLVPPPPAPAPAAPKPIASYNADPYREPIDEPLSEM